MESAVRYQGPNSIIPDMHGQISSDSGFDSNYTDDMESISTSNYEHQEWRNRRLLFTFSTRIH